MDMLRTLENDLPHAKCNGPHGGRLERAFVTQLQQRTAYFICRCGDKQAVMQEGSHDLGGNIQREGPFKYDCWELGVIVPTCGPSYLVG